MDREREVRGEKDAMTVEIVFAFLSATLLAGAVLGVALAAAVPLGLHGVAGRVVLMGGALVGVLAGAWRLLTVLVRFDAHRRQGH